MIEASLPGGKGCGSTESISRRLWVRSARISANGRRRHRVNRRRGHFDQRLENKSPHPHSRMRHAQLGRVDDPVIKQKQVEIQRPLAPANRSLASELGLDILQALEATRAARGLSRPGRRRSRNFPWPGGPPTGSVSRSELTCANGDAASPCRAPRCAPFDVGRAVAQITAHADAMRRDILWLSSSD